MKINKYIDHTNIKKEAKKKILLRPARKLRNTSLEEFV